MLMKSEYAKAGAGETLIQPSEVRSEKRILRTPITASAYRVPLGDFAFAGFVYNGALSAFAYVCKYEPCRASVSEDEASLAESLADRPKKAERDMVRLWRRG